MKCPLCKNEMRIESNDLVQRSDGTLAYRMQLKCRSKNCSNYNQVTKTIYDSIEPIIESEEE